MSSTSWWRPHQDGENTRHATAALHATEDDSPPPAYDMAALLAAHPCLCERDRVAGVARRAWCSVRSCFRRSGRRAHCGGGSQHRAGRGRAAWFDPLPAGAPTACTRRCWMPVSSPSPLTQASRPAGSGGLLLPLGVRRLRAYGPTRNARYCYTRVTRARRAAGGEADLDVLDEHGTVLLAVRGLRHGNRGLRKQ